MKYAETALLKGVRNRLREAGGYADAACIPEPGATVDKWTLFRVDIDMYPHILGCGPKLNHGDLPYLYMPVIDRSPYFQRAQT